MNSTMADLPIDDLNVASNETLITPEQLKREIPLTDAALQTVAHGREVIRNILDGKDHRLFVVVGPCSMLTMTLSPSLAKVTVSARS